MIPSGPDRIFGCLYGGAVGDALGAPVEFLTLGEIRRQYGPAGITGYVEFWSGQGAFTDDTQMTLFTAEGLVLGGGSGPARPFAVSGPADASAEDLFRTRRREADLLGSVHRSYLRWLLTQGQQPDWARARTTESSLKAESRLVREKGLWIRRSPGMTCLAALRSGRSGSTADPINVSKGCGGVMRAAPAGLWCPDPKEAFRLGCEIAAITHGNATGYLPAGFLASIVSVLMGGGGLAEAVERSIAILTAWEGHGETLDAVKKAGETAGSAHSPENIERLSGRKGEGAGRGGGWTAEEALAVAVYCALRFPEDFRGGVLAAVNHDGDSDSTAAVTGNILGAKLGRAGIPREWIDGLELAAVVEGTARELLEAVRG